MAVSTHGIQDHPADLSNFLDLLARGSIRELGEIPCQSECEISASRIAHQDDVLRLELDLKRLNMGNGRTDGTNPRVRVRKRYPARASRIHAGNDVSTLNDFL